MANVAGSIRPRFGLLDCGYYSHRLDGEEMSAAVSQMNKALIQLWTLVSLANSQASLLVSQASL